MVNTNTHKTERPSHTGLRSEIFRRCKISGMALQGMFYKVYNLYDFN